MFTRRENTTSNGRNFDAATIAAVWNKGRIVPGYDSNQWRKDACGAWIARNKYGDITHNGNGWEIDHIFPVAHGGSDDLSNLQPLQWQNNRAKGDGPLSCPVKAA